ncbi:protein of unknown function (plasmid) [Azospirillum lipoferum 4B]|uniref:Uncharacterized protein n=1 Tax=Azospirillum lipoferum (strain 4B) TaxID=862719 RepID=G7ZFP2_AZOL4|nr:protein of unknown function [Azospirillum lipoferum 4B]
MYGQSADVARKFPTAPPLTGIGRSATAGFAAEEVICPKLFTTLPRPFKSAGHFVQSTERLSGCAAAGDMPRPGAPRTISERSPNDLG